MSLEERVGELLRVQHLTLAIAESCTGGLLGHLITNVPGSSDYFLGGVVAYSNVVKERLLRVQRKTLVEEGSVSEAVALEMARGVRSLFGSALSLSITGIAGPGGGTAERPVGLVYITLAAADSEICEQHIWSGDREENKRRSAERAIELLWEYLK
jgi:PncC family amidohydrolase